MTLKERAIKAWEEEEEKRKVQERERAEEFAKIAEDEFQNTFGKVSELKAVPVSGDEAEVIADGLTFIAKRERNEYRNYIRFYIQIECASCHRPFTYPYRCEGIIDLGRILSESHIYKSHICDSCRYEIANIAETSQEERIITLMKELVREIMYAVQGEM